MATAVHPRPSSTAGLTSSQSQSAPVFEYRCMFTHDVRKKAKKWHDGSLRFHTFNKRVMVYDDTKNLVGSLHYRSQDDFGEGLELNLDSHVLVQVEEKLSESSTDLTPLLSRQKQDGADHFVRPDPPTRATLSRINAANSQIKPKSIKELLAGSQGTIGRARLPIKSPYEARHPLTETQPPEPEPQPEPKRRKIIHDKENNVEIRQSVQPSTKKRTLIEKAQPEPPSDIVDISSEDELTLLPQTGRTSSRPQQVFSKSSEVTALPPKITSTTKRNLELPVSAEPKRQKKNQQAQSEASPPCPEEHASKKPKKSRQKPDETLAKPSSASSSFPKTSTAATGVSQIRHPSGPRSSLKFAAEKSRPKLMYRALLANSSKPTSSNQSTTATSDSRNDASPDPNHDNERRIRRSRPTNVIDTDKLFDPSQISRDTTVEAVAAEPLHSSYASDASLNLDHNKNEIDQATPKSMHSNNIVPVLDEDITETVPDSPMFLPRTTSQISPLPSQNLVLDDGHVSFLSQALNKPTSKKSLSPAPVNDLSTQSPAGVESPRRSPEPPSSPVFHKQLSPDPRPDKPDSISIPLKADARHRNASASSAPIDQTLSLPPAFPAQVRLFRRVVSESFQRTGMSPEVLSDDSDDDPDTFNEILENNMPTKSPLRPERPPAESHNFSDPVEIRPTSPTPNSASSSPDFDNDAPQIDADDATTKMPAMVDETAEYIPIEESGPWTSTEAFLLFDWWPPGRQKPPYAVNTSTATNGLDTTESRSLTRNNLNSMSKKKYGTFGSAKFVSQR